MFTDINKSFNYCVLTFNRILKLYLQGFLTEYFNKIFINSLEFDYLNKIMA